jgi:uncharacterized protein YndB with AHSA1/START domain
VVERTVSGESIVISRTYATDIDDLWEACTSPERVPRWFLPVSGDLRPGGNYSLEGNASGTIESCDPPHGFRITWEFGGGVSYVELRLTAVDADHTRFELIHSGLGGSHWDEFGPGAVGVGWDGGLYGLEMYLAGGEMPDPSWIRSDEAKQFYRASAAGWREAHVAAGAPADIAQASADRTIAAYTGGPS